MKKAIHLNDFYSVVVKDSYLYTKYIACSLIFLIVCVAAVGFNGCLYGIVGAS